MTDMSRKTQRRIEQFVRARGIPLDPPGTPALYAAAEKLAEEMCEVGDALAGDQADLECRVACTPDLAALRTEMADVYVVLARMANIVEGMTGVPFDLEAEALAKAERDVARGVARKVRA